MSATLVWNAVLISLLWTPWLAAQSGAPNSTTTCNLEDGRQVYVRYNAVSNKDKPINGKPWSPGGAPMTLFTEAQLGDRTGRSGIGRARSGFCPRRRPLHAAHLCRQKCVVRGLHREVRNAPRFGYETTALQCSACAGLYLTSSFSSACSAPRRLKLDRECSFRTQRKACAE